MFFKKKTGPPPSRGNVTAEWFIRRRLLQTFPSDRAAAAARLEDAGAYAALMGLIPYQRIGEPADIARAVVWLASDDSDYVVGTTLFVDGGMTLDLGFAEGG